MNTHTFTADTIEDLVKSVWYWQRLNPNIEIHNTNLVGLKYTINFTNRFPQSIVNPGDLVIHCAFWGINNIWTDVRALLLGIIGLDAPNTLTQLISFVVLGDNPHGIVKNLYVCYSYGSNVHMIECIEQHNRTLTISPLGAKTNTDIPGLNFIPYP